MTLDLTANEIGILQNIALEFGQYRMHDILTRMLNHQAICTLRLDEITWLKHQTIKKQQFNLAVKLREYEKSRQEYNANKTNDMKLELTDMEVVILGAICIKEKRDELSHKLLSYVIDEDDPLQFTKAEIIWLKQEATKKQHFDLSQKLHEYQVAMQVAAHESWRKGNTDQTGDDILLTHDNIYRLGFRGEGKDLIGKPAYRLKVPPENGFCYSYEIQLVIDPNLPETNYNSGIVSLYRAGTKDAHMVVEEKDSDTKADFVLWEHEEQGLRGGIKYIDIREMCQPIAGHVTHLSRLNAIYTALTRNKPLELRAEPNKQ